MAREDCVEGESGVCRALVPQPYGERRREGVKGGDCRTGIVVADWVGLDGDWDLARCVVGMNAKLIR